MKKSLFGIYPGKLKDDVDYIKKCSEMELFLQVNCYYEPIRMLTYYSKMKKFYQKLEDTKATTYFQNKIEELLNIKNIKTESDFNEYKYTADFCILQTSRFGTNVVYNVKGNIVLTEEFKNWYNKWQAYISTMDDDTLSFYRRCRYEGKHLDLFHPNNKPEVLKELITDLEEFNQPYQLVKKSIKQVSA